MPDFDPKKIAITIKKLQRDAAKALKVGEDAAAKKALKLLADLDRDIRIELASLPAKNFNATHLNKLLVAINDRLAQFNQDMARTVGATTRGASELGRQFFTDQFGNIIKAPSMAGGITPVVSEELLSVSANMSVELIRGVANDLSKQITTSLQRAIIGQKTPFEAAKEVAKLIGPGGGSGASASAERIVRTEVNRAFNTADEFVRQSAQASQPEGSKPLKKIWVTADDSRVRDSHEAVHKQVRNVSRPFDVPIVKQRNGQSVKVGTEQLDYPLDPAGSPGNTINCRCTTVTVPTDMVDEMLASIPGSAKSI